MTHCVFYCTMAQRPCKLFEMEGGIKNGIAIVQGRENTTRRLPSREITPPTRLKFLLMIVYLLT